MANSITLTVNVRDLTRGAFRRIETNLARLRRELERRSTRGNFFDDASRNLDRLRNRLNTSSAFVGRFRGSLMRATAQGLQPMIKVTDRLGHALRLAFRAGADGVTHLHRSLLVTRRALGILTAPLRLLGRGFAAMGRGAMHGNRAMLIVLATLVLIGPAAQALGALLITALGGAFIALGAFALKGSASVKRAFSDMKESVASDVRAAAQPMEGFLVNGIKQVQQAVSTMRPALTEAFTATGPLIENFFGAFTDMAQKSLPGIVAALQSMGPAMQGFRTAMGLIGEGFGKMFEAMTANGGAEALGRVWVVLGKELQNLLVGIGEFINLAAKSNTVTALTVTVFRTLSGILNVVGGAFKILDAAFGGLLSYIADAGPGIAAFGTNVEDAGKIVTTHLGPAFVTASRDIDLLKKNLSSVDKALADVTKQRKEWEDFKGPKSFKRERIKSLDEEEKNLLTLRRQLTESIAQAEASATQSTYAHAAAVNALKESIRALNEQNLTRLDAQGAMEKAIDDAAKKSEELTGKVKIQNGVINQGNDAGRQAHEVLSAIARTTSEYVTKLQEANAPQNEINAAWARGREQLIGMHDELGVSKAELAAYADIVMQTPQSVTTKLEVEKKQAEANVDKLKSRLSEVDGKTAKAQTAVETFRAMERLSMVESKLNALNGKTSSSWVFVNVKTNYLSDLPKGMSVHDVVGATGGMFTGTSFTKRGLAGGGPVSGPGTGTSDDIFAPWLSNGEFVINARQTKKYLPLIEAINRDKLKFGPGMASGGMKDARKSLSSQFGISLFGRMAGYQFNPFEKGLGKPADMGSLVSTLNGLLSSIKKAFDGSKEKSLTNRLVSSGKALIKHEQKLTKVNDSLEKAKAGLDSLKQSAASLRDSVRSGVMSATDITKAATGDKAIGMADIMTVMRNNVDKATAFAKALADLQKMGFSGDIVRQVAEAGIEGGGLETASALLTASAADVATLNTAQAQINSAAKAAGKTAADAMYGAGIKAAQGLVDGLTAKKKAIEKAMMDIAKAMEKAIKSALGIKSPSRVMMRVGQHTAEGFALGMENNRSVDTAWSSMLNTGPTAGRSAAAAAGGGTYTFPVYIGNKLLDEIVLDSNRRTVRTRGGNVQNVFGQRNG